MSTHDPSDGTAPNSIERAMRAAFAAPDGSAAGNSVLEAVGRVLGNAPRVCLHEAADPGEPLIDPDEAAGIAYAPDDQAIVDALRRKAFAGTAERVAERLRAEATRLALDELVIVTWTYDPAARLRSTTLLAQALGI